MRLMRPITASPPSGLAPYDGYRAIDPTLDEEPPHAILFRDIHNRRYMMAACAGQPIGVCAVRCLLHDLHGSIDGGALIAGDHDSFERIVGQGHRAGHRGMGQAPDKSVSRGRRKPPEGLILIFRIAADLRGSPLCLE